MQHARKADNIHMMMMMDDEMLLLCCRSSSNNTTHYYIGNMYILHTVPKSFVLGVYKYIIIMECMLVALSPYCSGSNNSV